jgi:uncharacterized protein YbaA (DUF1428 family)
VLPVPKANLAAYRRFAREMGNIWKEYDALECVECVADDIRACSSPRGPRLSGMAPASMPFDGKRMIFGGIEPMLRL